MPKHQYVILGGGVVAGYAAQEFVKQGVEPHELAIVSADTILPYERPPLSKDYLEGDETPQDIYINSPALYRENAIDVYLKTRITRVDAYEKVLYTQNDDEIEFERLLIATGSSPRTLDIPGADAEGLKYLRSLGDSREIREYTENANRVVILGGGYIGMETAAVMSESGLDVTMVFPSERLMESRFFTPEMSDFFRQYFTARGVKIMNGELPAEILTQDGKVSGVKLESGKTLDADLVIAGIGITLNDDLLDQTHLEIDDGLVVNQYLETNIPGIYAAGDIANYYDVTFGKYRRVGHWDNAKSQGRYAARRMIGNESESYEQIPYFFSDVFDLSYEFWGEAREDDEVIYRGDVDSGEFSAWWLRDGGVVGAFVMGRPDEERQAAQEWVAEHTRVDPVVLRDTDRYLLEAAPQST